MANAAANYLKAIKEKSVGYRPTWEPNKTLQIGDVGRIEDGVFVKWNTLEKMGINLEVQKDEREGSLFDLSTENGVNVRTKAAGKVDPGIPSLGEMDAGFSVEFKKQNAILFKIHGYLTHQISNLGEIAGEILKRYKAGDWDQQDVIINELIEAKKATIMMSSEGGVTIGLKAKGNVGGDKLNIADADFDSGVDNSGKLAINITGEAGITPLYRVVGIKKKFWGLGKTDVGTRKAFDLDPFAEEEAEVLDEPTSENLFGTGEDE
jgi:hypothetical protein